MLTSDSLITHKRPSSVLVAWLKSIPPGGDAAPLLSLKEGRPPLLNGGLLPPPLLLNGGRLDTLGVEAGEVANDDCCLLSITLLELLKGSKFWPWPRLVSTTVLTSRPNGVPPGAGGARPAKTSSLLPVKNGLLVRPPR